MNTSIGRLISLFFICFCIFSMTMIASAQRRDEMTEAEIELVRDSQDIDLRITVLTKMIDRRFAALGIEVAGWKPPAKESEKWGNVPDGTRLELFTDIRKLLQKAIDDVDDVAVHNENSQTQNKKEGLLFPKAVRALAAAATRYTEPLKKALETSKDEKEKGTIMASLEYCGQIVEAVAKLPPEVKKPKN